MKSNTDYKMMCEQLKQKLEDSQKELENFQNQMVQP